MVFVADTLGAWLVEQLADAGRKRLTEVVLGREQERALRRAADAAVWATAEEMSPSGNEQARQIAMVISEVFRDPEPDAPLAGPVMLLQGLQAVIARQLTVLDDAGLTGTGQSSADVLGVRGTVLADRLTSHLVREIIIRGSGGGPLTPLADQLNHELTRLQGQRIEGILARLAAEVQDGLARPGNDVPVAGRPLREVIDPFVLEVHRPVQPEDAPRGLPVLPLYVPRGHDQVLGQVVRAAAAGRSGIAVLVGGSSTGKTRACWETLALLRGEDPPWRLWHPIDPSRPDAALRVLPVIGPRTVVWLNEAQFYLDVEDGLGERVAAGLRELLRDPGRAPVLVLATVWPRFWGALTARPAGDDDRHAQARELLAGHDITVASAFTPAQMDKLFLEGGDVRMVLAARSAADGEVIQFLAGAPELLARYRNAPPAARAVIDAALDARRLGMGAGLPRAFLEAAVPGYLTDAEWDGLGEDWLDQALAYTAVPCKGACGPLTRVRPRPARPVEPDCEKKSTGLATTTGPLHRLADYLDQYGRTHRAGQIPPSEFWSAVAAHAAPDDQVLLGGAAYDRGLYRVAAQLYKNAAASGSLRAARYLSDFPGCLHADPRFARWAAVHASLDNLWAVADLLDSFWRAGADEHAATLADRAASQATLDLPGEVARLLNSLRQAGAHDQAAALLARGPAAHAALDNPAGVASLLNSLRQAGAHDQAAALLARGPAAHAALDNPRAVVLLIGSLRKVGAHDQAAALADRAAARAALYPRAVTLMIRSLRSGGMHQAAAALADRAAAHAPLDNPGAVAKLLDGLREAGAHEQSTALLARRAAAHAPLDNPGAVADLLESLRDTGVDEQTTALADRAAAYAPVDNPGAVVLLLCSLWEVAADKQAAVLAERAAVHAPLENPGTVATLLASLREAGADKQVAALLARSPATHAALDDPRAVASLLASLREADADKQVAALLARSPATHAAIDDPGGVTRLLDSLRWEDADEQAAALADRAAAHGPIDNLDAMPRLLSSLRLAGAREQAAALADRVAAHGPLDDWTTAAYLLDSLRKAGAVEQAATLASRLPAVGMFRLFLEQQGFAEKFRFGREPDGAPAAPWGWENLDLCLLSHPQRQAHQQNAERDAGSEVDPLADQLPIRRGVGSQQSWRSSACGRGGSRMQLVLPSTTPTAVPTRQVNVRRARHGYGPIGAMTV